MDINLNDYLIDVTPWPRNRSLKLWTALESQHHEQAAPLHWRRYLRAPSSLALENW